MMIGFFKGLWQYRTQVKKQHKWIVKYTAQKNYALNPSWMMSTNLEIWLSEMEATFGKRYCPCFEPSGDAKLDKQMLCPCEFIEDEIKEYGTCHCALFGSADLDKAGWKASSKRLMGDSTSKTPSSTPAACRSTAAGTSRSRTPCTSSNRRSTATAAIR